MVSEPGIDRLFREWASAIERQDVEALLELVVPDGEFWTHGAAPLVGREALRAAFEAFFSRFASRQDFELVELMVRDDLAVARGVEHNHLLPKAGGEAIELDQRAFSILLRDAAGRWRFARGMTNLPPAAPNQETGGRA